MIEYHQPTFSGRSAFVPKTEHPPENVTFMTNLPYPEVFYCILSDFVILLS